MKTTLPTFVTENILPEIANTKMTFDAARNMFISMGYTSLAGNTYYKALRCSKRLAILYYIGEGYCHTFLNGITMLAWNGRKTEVIAQKFWGGSNWRCFTEQSAKVESVLMLRNFLEGQAKALGQNLREQDLLDFSRAMVNETECSRLIA